MFEVGDAMRKYPISKMHSKRYTSMEDGKLMLGTIAHANNRWKQDSTIVALSVSLFTLVLVAVFTSDNFFVWPNCAISCPRSLSISWDDSFSCPDLVAIPRLLCVSNSSLCPEALRCPANIEACSDGSCPSPRGSCNSTTMDDVCANSCGIPCFSKELTETEFKAACAQVSASGRSSCLGENEFDWNKPQYWFTFAWFAFVVPLTLLWCGVNQRLLSSNPAYAPTVTTYVISEEKKLSKGEEHLLAPELHVQQTGYAASTVGAFVLGFVVNTVFLIHVCLIVLTTSYYSNESGCGWTIEPNNNQALAAFEIIWTIGIAWMVIVQSPANLRLHFWRRSPLASSDYVSVWTPASHHVLGGEHDLSSLDNRLASMASFWSSFIRGIYSDVTLPDAPGQIEVCEVSVSPTGERFINYRLRRLVYIGDFNAFMPIVIPVASFVDDILDSKDGLTSIGANFLQAQIGPNEIRVQAPSLLRALLEEFSKGFYTYQAFMSWTWFNFASWHLGLVVTSTYSVGGIAVSYVKYKNQCILYSLVSTSHKARVLRDGTLQYLPAADLVPGDVIVVEAGLCVVDAVIIKGRAILDESSLTGEATPVYKEAINASSQCKYSPQIHKKSTILSGTAIVQGGSHGEQTLALVLKTGCDTDKGKQVGEILFQEPPKFKFDIQVKMVVIILAIYAVFGFCATMLFLGDKPPEIAWFYAIYVVMSALPPLLPTVFVVAVGIGANRLRSKGVICSDPNRLLVAGKVRVCCFDKTGTLTKASMDFHGVRPMNSEGFMSHTVNVPRSSILEAAMATCHALSKVDKSEHAFHGGAFILIGAAVDKMMFEATGWELTQRNDGISVSDGKRNLWIIRRYDFDHAKQMSSVIVREGENYLIFCKGSPEAIERALDSTPKSYTEISDSYSGQGCYTLGLGFRECSREEILAIEGDDTLTREQVETRLSLAGLVTFRNELKQDSTEALKQLKDGACRLVMLTGDHALTAIVVAQQVGMLSKSSCVLRTTRLTSNGDIEWTDENDNQVIEPYFRGLASDPELVILGPLWRTLSAEAKSKLLQHTRIFARCSPTDKLDVINLYKAQGFVVSMCGDGGNDCGALRAAHVGVALSDAEASIVSPFTGVSKSCMSVVDVLIEGRGALASAFAAYRYMVMYGQIETMNQIINAYFAISFNEWCWAFMDGFWVVSLSFTVALAEPAKKLSRLRPPSSLLGWYTMASVIGMVVINFIFVCVGLGILHSQPWFQCRKWDPQSADMANLFSIGDNFETSVIFVITGCQFLSAAIAVNFGFKHRLCWASNWRLVTVLSIFWFINIWIIFIPSKLSCLFRINCTNDNIEPGILDKCRSPISNSWNSTVMPVEFRVSLFLLVFFNTITIVMWEYIIILGPFGNYLRRRFPQTKELRL